MSERDTIDARGGRDTESHAPTRDARLAGLAGGLASDDQGAAMFGAIFGVGAIIALPIFYGVLGFVMMLIMAALFNLCARMMGGLEVDVH